MPEITSYEHGVPSWADVGASDIPRAARFYAELFGWEVQDLGEDTGHYTMCSKGGRPVAAVSGTTPGTPPHWTTYINVDDADAVADKVEGAGGMILAGPMDVLSSGRMLVLADPTGAVVAAWQPREHRGAALVDEPGTVAWNELSTSDPAAAKAFYGEVFGWGWDGSEQYAEAKVGGRSVAGVMPRPAGLPAEVPDNWLVYLATDDIDRDTARAQQLGASLQMGPTAIEGTGRFSVLLDPQGAAFALFEPAS